MVTTRYFSKMRSVGISGSQSWDHALIMVLASPSAMLAVCPVHLTVQSQKLEMGFCIGFKNSAAISKVLDVAILTYTSVART